MNEDIKRQTDIFTKRLFSEDEEREQRAGASLKSELGGAFGTT